MKKWLIAGMAVACLIIGAAVGSYIGTIIHGFVIGGLFGLAAAVILFFLFRGRQKDTEAEQVR